MNTTKCCGSSNCRTNSCTKFCGHSFDHFFRQLVVLRAVCLHVLGGLVNVLQVVSQFLFAFLSTNVDLRSRPRIFQLFHDEVLTQLTLEFRLWVLVLMGFLVFWSHFSTARRSRRLPVNCVDSNSTNFVTVVAVVCGSYRRSKRRHASNSSGSPAFRIRSSFNCIMNARSLCTAPAFDLRLTGRQILHPVGGPTINSSEPSLILHCSGHVRLANLFFHLLDRVFDQAYRC